MLADAARGRADVRDFSCGLLWRLRSTGDVQSATIVSRGLACRGPSSTRTWPIGHGTRVTGSPEDVVGCSGRLLLPNTTQVPNVVLDRWMAPMTGAEIKVVLYVVRRTYGFRRTSDRISVAQMSMGHGSFSTTMKYYTGFPADLQKQPAEVL